MHFIPIWLFFAVIMTGLTYGYGQELSGLFFLINFAMGLGALIYVVYAKVYHHEYRNVYRYLVKCLKG